jgi:hypothetical protein
MVLPPVVNKRAHRLGRRGPERSAALNEPPGRQIPADGLELHLELAPDHHHRRAVDQVSSYAGRLKTLIAGPGNRQGGDLLRIGRGQPLLDNQKIGQIAAGLETPARPVREVGHVDD